MFPKPFKAFIVPEALRNLIPLTFSRSKDYVQFADSLYLAQGYMSLSDHLNLRAHTYVVLLVRMA